MSEDSSKPKRKLGLIGTLVGSALAFISPDFALLAVAPFLSSLNVSDNVANFALALAYEAALIGVLAIVMKFYGLGWQAIGLGKFKVDFIPWAAIAFIVYIIVAQLVMDITGLFFKFDVDQNQDILFNPPQDNLEAVLVFAALVILAPLAEELLFRGFLFTGLRKKLPFWLTAIIVSLLFGFVHGQVNVGLDVFALSLVMCFIREKTGSLWPSLLLHSFKNGLAYFLLFVYDFSG